MDERHIKSRLKRLRRCLSYHVGIKSFSAEAGFERFMVIAEEELEKAYRDGRESERADRRNEGASDD